MLDRCSHLAYIPVFTLKTPDDFLVNERGEGALAFLFLSVTMVFG